MFQSVIKQIYDCLKDNGFDVYFPGQYKGECLNPYVVVKQSGSIDTITVSSERPMYDLMVYAPENNYSMLEQIVYDMKQCLKKLYPMITYSGNETSAYYDDEKKAHMISVQYYGIRKVEYF